MRKRYQKHHLVLVDRELLVGCCKTKESADALAFAILVRMTFVNGTVYGASIDKLCKIFHIGHVRMNRILKYCRTNTSILTWDGKVLQAVNHKSGSLNAQFTNKKATFGRAGECVYRIKEVLDMMHMLSLSHYLKCTERFSNSLNKVATPDSSKSYRRAKRNLRKLGTDWDKVEVCGVSYNTLSAKEGVCKTRVQRYVNQLVGYGCVVKTRRLERHKDDVDVNEENRIIKEDNLERGKSVALHQHVFFKSHGYIFKSYSNTYNVTTRMFRLSCTEVTSRREKARIAAQKRKECAALTAKSAKNNIKKTLPHVDDEIYLQPKEFKGRIY